MDLEETKAKSDCVGEDQQQFNQPNDSVWGLRPWRFVKESSASEDRSRWIMEIVGIRYQATTGEDIDDAVCAVMRNRVCRLATAL
jgi:hypothetical protein